jgi:putative DNA primase/helicase
MPPPPEPKAFVLYGDKAGNDKSQISNMICGLLPDYAVASVSPSQLDQDPYQLKPRGGASNAVNELGTSHTIASDRFKTNVTGESIAVNVKFSDAVTIGPRALHFFATNVLPPFTGGMDQGVRRRLCAPQFNRVFERHEMVGDIGRREGLRKAGLPEE